MNSELKIKSPNLKITITLGIILAATIIILAMVFRFEFGLILLAVAGFVGLAGIVGLAGVGGKLLFRSQVWRLDILIKKQDLRMITAKANKAELEAGILSFPSSQRQLISPDAPVRLIEATAGSYKELPANTQEPIELLPALDTVQRCLIVGASDTGKTTLSQHIISRRVQSSKVVVIDPHGYPDKWQGCTVVGTGRNYQEIDTTLGALIQLMTKRYKEIGQGSIAEMGHPKITILIDEWRAIVYNVKPASEAIKALLTESRKAAFSVFVATHSERVKALGIEGEGDLKDGFAVVRLSIADGQRQATIDTGNGEAQALLPGPFKGPSPQVIERDDLINLEVQPSQTEAAVLTLHEQGQSVSAIAESICGSKGGNQNQQVKDVLSKFGKV